eukprot:PhM_4_TR14162/c1_g2_i1/m.99585
MTRPISTAYVLSFRGRIWEDADHEHYSLLCNLSFEGPSTATEGPITGTLSVYHTKEVNIVLRGDLRLLPHSKWSHDPATGATNVSLHVFIEAVEGTVEALSHVTVKTEGVYASRKCTGTYDVYQAGKNVEAAPWPAKAHRTFSLQEATPLLCAHCFSPVTLDVPPKCSTCKLIEYCSEKCQQEDIPAHKELCRIAASAPAPSSTNKNGALASLVVCFEGTPFVVIFRQAGDVYVVFVDARNPALKRLYHFALGVFEEKKIDYNVEPGVFSLLQRQDVMILDRVAMYAISSQRTSFATACLHALHRDGHHMEQLERLYAMYYEFILCVGQDVDARHVNTLEEYIVMARPLFEYSTVLLEGALKSRLPSEFWARIDIAKNIAIQLFNSNSSAKFPHELMTEVVSHQQRQVLHLLAKIFITVASRLPQPRADDMLRRAVECYVDTIEDPLLHGSVLDLARTHLRLSCVQMMRCTSEFGSEEYRARAMKERQLAFELLDRHYATAPAAVQQQQQQQQQHNATDPAVVAAVARKMKAKQQQQQQQAAQQQQQHDDK